MDKKILNPEMLPDQESPVRRMVADPAGESYRALNSLAEAKAAPDGVLVFEGDYGGQIYLVARAQYVDCSEKVLQQLLVEIDSREWDNPDGARIYFEIQPVGQGISGGMGGGRVAESVWVHPRLSSLQTGIEEVLTGKADTVSIPARR